MAEIKTQNLERIYIVPLRKEWQKVANYRRAGRAIKAIKKFVAKHMKIPERDTKKVKLDIFLNQEIFFRGRKKPPAKIKIKAVKEGDLVRVYLAEMPANLQFTKQKLEKRFAKIEKEMRKEKAQTEEVKKEEEAQKKEEEEKEKAVAEIREAEIKQKAKEQKHTIKKRQPDIKRMALKK